jgi:hypothetical protein
MGMGGGALTPEKSAHCHKALYCEGGVNKPHTPSPHKPIAWTAWHARARGGAWRCMAHACCSTRAAKEDQAGASLGGHVRGARNDPLFACVTAARERGGTRGRGPSGPGRVSGSSARHRLCRAQRARVITLCVTYQFAAQLSTLRAPQVPSSLASSHATAARRQTNKESRRRPRSKPSTRARSTHTLSPATRAQA